MSEQQFNQNINSVLTKEILAELKKLFSQLSNNALGLGSPMPDANAKMPLRESAQNESAGLLTKLMLDNFESMLSSTTGMMKNMGVMEGGFAAVVKIILNLINSLSSGSAGGGGIFGALFGTIFGLVGGPLGAAIGSGLGGVLGSFSSHGSMPRSVPGSQQFPVNGLSPAAPKMINQIIIKNPVTFSRAFEVEVRNQSIRGSIDL